jgi:GH18 family chitinase
MQRSAVFYLVMLSVLILSFQSDKIKNEKGVNVMAYYYTRWANFKPDALPYDKLTHIIFSFTEVIDNEMKFPDDSLGLILKKLVKQKKKHQHLKVMVACGGWAGSGGFSEMARSPENRIKFVGSVVKFIRKNKLDGLDIDWEYPGMTGIGNPNLGWIKMEDIENTPAALKMIEEGDSTKPFSTEKIISYLINKGVNPAQIVIGSNFSGRAWQGVPPENNGLYQLNRGRWRGFGSYAKIRENIEDKNGFVRYWDPIAKAPYLYSAKDSVFITYDDTMSVRLKTKYAAETGLGGIMFWQLGADAPENGLVDAIYAEKMKHK